MKRNPTKSVVTAVVSAASLVFAVSVTAGTPSVTEIPAQVASQVAKATIDQREAVAKTEVAKAVAAKPAVATALVSAIAQSSPDVAAVAALTAISQDTKQIGEITKAAVAAAPKQAGKIVAAICQKFPTRYNLVAVAAYEAAPAAGNEILAAVASSVPAIKSFISRSAFNTLPSVIADTQNMLQAAIRSGKLSAEQYIAGSAVVASAPSYSPVALPPPTGGGPFIPVSGTPGEKGRGDSGVITPGQGRNYSGG